jgi:hypothetical protein
MSLTYLSKFGPSFRLRVDRTRPLGEVAAKAGIRLGDGVTEENFPQPPNALSDPAVALVAVGKLGAKPFQLRSDSDCFFIRTIDVLEAMRVHPRVLRVADLREVIAFASKFPREFRRGYLSILFPHVMHPEYGKLCAAYWPQERLISLNQDLALMDAELKILITTA